MRMINNTVLQGRLTKDIDLKYTGSGTAVGNFTLAVERSFKNAQGERETDFINCVVWRKQAELMSQYLSKGDPVNIIGSIQTRNYENNEGQRIYVTEVVANQFSFVPKVTGDNQEKKSNSKSNQESQKKNDNPFEDIKSSENPFDQSNVNDIEDEDLPF